MRREEVCVDFIVKGTLRELVSLHEGALEGVSLHLLHPLGNGVGLEAVSPRSGHDLTAHGDLGAEEAGLVEVGEGVDVVGGHAQGDGVHVLGQILGEIVLIHAEVAVAAAGGAVGHVSTVNGEKEGAGRSGGQLDSLIGGGEGGHEADGTVHVFGSTDLPDGGGGTEGIVVSQHDVSPFGDSVLS